MPAMRKVENSFKVQRRTMPNSLNNSIERIIISKPQNTLGTMSLSTGMGKDASKLNPQLLKEMN